MISVYCLADQAILLCYYDSLSVSVVQNSFEIE